MWRSRQSIQCTLMLQKSLKKSYWQISERHRPCFISFCVVFLKFKRIKRLIIGHKYYILFVAK
jgi:hypothetical protein